MPIRCGLAVRRAAFFHGEVRSRIDFRAPRIRENSNKSWQSKSGGATAERPIDGNGCSMSDSPKILIADSLLSLRQLLGMCCRKLGYEPVLAEDGLEALNLACSTSYHLIVTGYQMPRMNGVELCRHLRRQERHEQTPILLCSSALSKLDTDALGQELGSIAFVSKPLNLLSLPRLVQASARPPLDILQRNAARSGA